VLLLLLLAKGMDHEDEGCPGRYIRQSGTRENSTQQAKLPTTKELQPWCADNLLPRLSLHLKVQA
jgi:hypothetical protein